MNPHILQKLKEREIMISVREIEVLAESCELDSAIILKKEYYLSDNCYVILIIRRKIPITIMYRRVSQKLNCQQLNVDKIINLLQ